MFWLLYFSAKRVIILCGWRRLIVSNGLGLGMFARLASSIGYYGFLKLANQLFQPDTCHPADDAQMVLRVLPRAAR
jgi:hypothetical protein